MQCQTKSRCATDSSSGVALLSPKARASLTLAQNDREGRDVLADFANVTFDPNILKTKPLDWRLFQSSGNLIKKPGSGDTPPLDVR